jgi:hypothetical protein
MENTLLTAQRGVWSPRGALTALFLLIFVLSPRLLAGQDRQGVSVDSPQAQAISGENSSSQKTNPDPKTPQDDRIFYALPNFFTVENGALPPPLSPGTKFKMVARSTFDPVEFAFIGVQTGINQADNSNPTLGQGFVGFSRRYVIAYADAMIGNFGTSAAFPSLLHQDPRYYQMGKGKFARRFGYAALRIVVARSDAGKTEFNFSEFLGNSVAAGLSNTYHPGPHTIGSTTNVFCTQVALDAAGYELKEFWPDINHLIHHYLHRT